MSKTIESEGLSADDSDKVKYIHNVTRKSLSASHFPPTRQIFQHDAMQLLVSSDFLSQRKPR